MRESDQVRPGSSVESWSKITVVLLDRQVAYVDGIAVDIRLRHSVAISRAELIRGLIEAVVQSGLDLSDASTSEEMVEMVSDAWASGGRRKRG
jgi:hypothetical protein